ncbi:MAG: hypothetical protein U5R48_11625 [Gammaproteobacteria bacterium]|nr:hypothetical protein [Gammaproteobacteria bacterium]
MVAGVELVDGRGGLHRIDGGDELAAARLSLGLLGVMTRIRMRVGPAVRPPRAQCGGAGRRLPGTARRPLRPPPPSRVLVGPA